MTKAEAVKMFRELYKRWGGKRADPLAKQTEWNDWTDSLCKEGLITPQQNENWGQPF
tara:strand:+ start:6008 stop:6178 length:171 start_codon:yes stop_codon:yes gene_type:complete